MFASAVAVSTIFTTILTAVMTVVLAAVHKVVLIGYIPAVSTIEPAAEGTEELPPATNICAMGLCSQHAV